MEHERIQRTSSWSPTFTKRDPASVEPDSTVQKQTAPTPSPETPGTYTSPVPPDWVQQDPVMRKIMANNPVMRKILQQHPEWGIATKGNVTANEPESIQQKCASCQEDTSAQSQQGFLQQDSNPSTDEVQLAAKAEKPSESQIQQVAATGFSGISTSLPHLDRIQQSFGVDLSSVQAYIGGEAAGACQQMGAAAYASGDRIAFKEQPSLELAAHEAAHVVQQASGKVQLAGGIGQVGDKYENHADAVAAKVGAGESAAPLLADFTGPKTDRHPEILSQRQPPTNPDSTESHKSQTTVDRLNEGKRLFDSGLLMSREGNHQAALNFYEASLQLAPNESITWYNRGVALIRLNQLESALDSTRTALAINNNWVKAQQSFAWYNLGVISWRLGRFNEALQYYKNALELNPSYELAKTNLSNLEDYLRANPSLRNQSQQTPPESGNNFLQILLGALPGAFNEDQTGEEAIVDFLISLIPIIGQVADARDFAAYLYRIVFKGQVGEIGNWIGLALTLVGLVPVVGDIAKFLGKRAVKKGGLELGSNLQGVWKQIHLRNPGLVDNIPQLKGLLAQNWGKGVQAAKDRWNTALGQLLNWANSIPDLLFSGQKQQLIKAIRQVESQSDTMLKKAFDEIQQKIDEALDEIGRLINPNGEPITPGSSVLIVLKC
jgi:tetratricopeptide (TPR) repeat protein